MSILDELHRRSTASISFPLTNYLFNRRHIARDFKELMRTQWVSSDELQQIQLRKLRKQLAYAADWVPFYQRRFREIDFDPRDVKTLEDVSQLPALTRNDLVEHHHELVDTRKTASIEAAEKRGAQGLSKPVAFAPFRKHRLVRHTSSGSTGEPVVYYEDGSTSAASWAFEQLFKDWYGVRPGSKEIRMVRLATEHMPRGRTRLLRRWLWRHVVLPGMNLKDRDYLLSFNALREFRPEDLWGFTSALRGLSEFMLSENLRLSYRPQLIVTWAEPMQPYEEDVLTRAFNCPLTNLYSSHEVGHIACRCPVKSLHTDQNHLLVEVDGQATNLDDEDVGELIITTLFDSPMPFIRYRMGDVGRIGKTPCDCGRRLQTIESLHGRTYELFTTSDGRMISPNFWLHLFRRDHLAGFIKRFQITYKKDGGILIKIVRKKSHSLESDPELRRLITKNFGGQTQLEWRHVADITPEPSGKVPIVRFEK